MVSFFFLYQQAPSEEIKLKKTPFKKDNNDTMPFSDSSSFGETNTIGGKNLIKK